jgi:hypothetical protein
VQAEEGSGRRRQAAGTEGRTRAAAANRPRHGRCRRYGRRGKNPAVCRRHGRNREGRRTSRTASNQSRRSAGVWHSRTQRVIM